MNAPHLDERLTCENAVLLLVGHQVDRYTVARDIDPMQLTHNVVGLANAALALQIPVIATTTSENMWGSMIPELRGALPGVKVIERTTVEAGGEKRVESLTPPPRARAVW